MDPGGQRRQGHDRAVFRPRQSLHQHRRSGRGEGGLAPSAMRLEYFQLIDRIVALDLVGRTITAQAHVPLTSTVFEGHFPGHPLMPGVLLIEAMAQTSGWLVMATAGLRRMAYLAAVKEAKFRAFVTPGSALTITAELVHEGSGYAMTSARITAEGRPVCSA